MTLYDCNSDPSLCRAEEMRQIVSESGKRLRRVRRIAAAKAEQSKRRAFGRQMTEPNKVAAQKKQKMLVQ